jgi:hypothetical protein
LLKGKGGKEHNKLGGTLVPRRAIHPRAKAMSVAMGIPQPASPAPPVLTGAKMMAGTAMPPMAAAIGKLAFFIVESSPTEALA